MKAILPVSLGALLLFVQISCTSKTDQTTTTAVDSTRADSAYVQIAKEAYTFALPLVLIDITRRQSLMPGSAMGAAENSFRHLSVFPDAKFRAVVRANADTYYSAGMLNLEKEPIILSVPDTKGRYYMMPMMDAYSNVFASPGSRTTGNKAGNFVVTGPAWKGKIPEGMQQIKAPTNTVWIIGRTQVNSKEDGIKVVQPIQKQYTLTPLSAWGKSYTTPALIPDTTIAAGDPNKIVESMSVEEFFNYANKLMVVNPPAEKDKEAVAEFSKIGVGPGQTFDISKFNANIQAEMKNIPAEIFGFAHNFFSNPDPKELINGWGIKYHLGNYGVDYKTRALVSISGLGANLPEDAIYPSCAMDTDGNKLDGANNYVIHFEKGQTPPAQAFWSLTMYDSIGYMVENPINRNVIGDRSDLKKNADGSVDIYIQHASPGKDKENNWLPAPAGSFNILMRVYWPKEEMLNGSWKIPGVKKM